MSFSEWREVTLSDITIGNKGDYGIGASAVEYSKDLYTYLRITDISDDGILKKESLMSVDDENSKNYLLKPNDIVFARTGNSTGRSYFYDGSDGELVYAGFLIKFSLDPSKVNPKFIRYYTLSNEYKDWVSSFSTGSTRSNINAKTYGNMKIKLPPTDQQDFLVRILSTIDDKIQVNNQINKTLENMAQAIFKQWFVDFEFPNEDGEPYKSSGGEMVESELGMIPKGWEVGSFSEYISSMLGGDWGKDSPQGNYTQKVYCLRGADINDIVAGNKGKMPERYIIEKNLIKKKLNSGNLVVEISGGSPTQSTGRIAYVSSDLLKRYNSPLVATNFCRAIKLKKDEHMEFFYNYWKALYQNNVFFHYENGTTGIKNLDISSFIERHPIVIPNENIIKMFTHQVKLFYKMHQNYGVENSQIETLRDSLLPKLMSGEIRVPMDEEGDVS